jgi:hypothetical protein
MTSYVHHVPGRLRVRIAALKKDTARGRQAKFFLDAIPGVLETEVSNVTGSVVIKYDARLVSSTGILDALRVQGYIQDTHPIRASQAVQNDGTQKIADVLMTRLIETVVERSAIALIAAVI